MSGYREIIVPGEAGRARPSAPRRAAAHGDWRAVLVGALTATRLRSSTAKMIMISTAATGNTTE